MEKLYIPKSAMAIVAHPDDIEFSCAGTLARWAKQGAILSFVLCTSGDVGISQIGVTKEKATQIRENEAKIGGEILGASELVFLRYPDGLLQPTLELRRRLVREIRRFKPEVILCGDPTIVWAGNDYINHPDHRAAATAALDATFPAAGQRNLYEEFELEGIFPCKPRKVFVTSWEGSDYFVNIEETIGQKIQALRAHESQMNGWDPEESIRSWAAEAGRGKEMRFAESFRVVTLVSDKDWEQRLNSN